MNVERALFLFGLDEIDKKEIRKQYLRKCREYHPDKHINAREEERREYTRKFNELQDAYILLNIAYSILFQKFLLTYIIRLTESKPMRTVVITNRVYIISE